MALIVSLDSKSSPTLTGWGPADQVRAKYLTLTAPKGGSLQYWETGRLRPKVKLGEPPKAQAVEAEEEDEPKPQHHGKSKH